MPTKPDPSKVVWDNTPDPSQVTWDVAESPAESQRLARQAARTDQQQMGQNFRDLAQGAKSAFDRTALGVKGLFPQSVQDVGDAFDHWIGSGGLTKETAARQPDNAYGTTGALTTDIGLSVGPVAGLTRTMQALRASPVVASVLANAGYAGATTPENRSEAAAMGAVIPAVVPLLRGFKPSTEVQLLQDAGVTPTVGQALGGNVARAENWLRNVPGAGQLLTRQREVALQDWQQATRNSAMPIALGKAAGSVDDVAAAYSDAYKGVLNRVDPDRWTTPNFSGVNASNASKGLPVTGEQIQEADALVRKLIDGAVNSWGDRAPTPLQLQQLESTIKKLGFKYIKSTDPRQQAFGDLVFQYGRDFGSRWRNAPLQGITGESLAYPLSKVDAGYPNLKTLQDAAARNPDLGSPDAYTPKVLLRALKNERAVPSVVADRASLNELALAGEHVLGSKPIEQGTLVGNLGAIATGAVAHYLGAPVAIPAAVLSNIYALPVVQKHLLGQGVTAKVFQELTETQQQALLQSAVKQIQEQAR